MVPEDWESFSLSQLYEFKNGLNADKASYGHGVPFVNVMDIFAADQLFADSLRGSVAATEKSAREFAVKSGDVLFNRTSETIEEIAFSAVYLDTKPAVFGGFVIRGRPKSDLVDALYSKYLFKSASFRKEAMKACQGAFRANIGQKDLAKIVMTLPPRSEQAKIAQILSTWDQAIAATERLLENSQQRKKGLMQQLLTGKKRLPGFEGEWNLYHLGCLFTERSEIGSKDLPLLSITSNEGVVYQNETGRKDTSNADKSKYKRVCPGDIGYNTMRMWQGRSSLSDKEGVVSPAYTILTATGKSDPLFFSYLFKLTKMVHVFYRHSQGLVSDTWNLKFKQFKKITCRVPGRPEQSAIAKILVTTDFEINALRVRMNSLKQEKKALMQQLLTGKRRVNMDREVA
tara:strand:+ start:25154 stop:26356 length:1203 start_codon:yes stop_codon:yes gene_type:complete